MQPLYNQFNRSILWNSIESILYQLIFLGHQLWLFKVMNAATYGLVGLLFSSAYLLIEICNLGLDASLAPFYTALIKDKSSFKKILFIQLLPEYCLLAALLCLGLLLRSSIIILKTLEPTLLVIIGGIIFFEGAKKTLRMLLHLAFLNKKTAYIEIGSIIGYVTFVWSYYALHSSLSLYAIFLPMLLISCASSLFLAGTLYSFYSTLATKDQAASPLVYKRMLQTRAYVYVNTISHMLFSSNFLVPFFAFNFSLNQAGVLKLVSTIAYSITSIMQKIFGISSSALLAHMKDMALPSKQQAFRIMTQRLYQVLYGIIIFFIINHHIIFTNSSAYSHNELAYIYLFLILTFSETFFITYEKFYIAEEKTEHLFLFNCIAMALFIFVLSYAHLFSPSLLFCALLAIRFFSFLLIGLASFNRWRLKPYWNIQPLFFIFSLAISLSFFWIMS